MFVVVLFESIVRYHLDGLPLFGEGEQYARGISLLPAHVLIRSTRRDAAVDDHGRAVEDICSYVLRSTADISDKKISGWLADWEQVHSHPTAD